MTLKVEQNPKKTMARDDTRRHGKAREDTTRHGKARQGTARHEKARQGTRRHGHEGMGHEGTEYILLALATSQEIDHNVKSIYTTQKTIISPDRG